MYNSVLSRWKQKISYRDTLSSFQSNGKDFDCQSKNFDDFLSCFTRLIMLNDTLLINQNQFLYKWLTFLTYSSLSRCIYPTFRELNPYPKVRHKLVRVNWWQYDPSFRKFMLIDKKLLYSTWPNTLPFLLLTYNCSLFRRVLNYLDDQEQIQ